jgi:glycosyltransferase involved in cell wall biosynthesis
MNKKVLLFTTGNCGGSERVTLTLSRILHNHFFEVKNIILELDSKEELVPFIPLAIPFERIKIRRLRNSLFVIFKIIKKEKPDFVFASISLIGVMLVMLSGFFRNTKVIIRQGFMPLAGLDGSPRLIKIFYKKAYKIIAQTVQMKESMIQEYGINKGLITVVHNPIDEFYINNNKNAVSPYPNSNDIKFVAVGRIGVFKDYVTLINAFELVHARNSTTHLYILGADYDKEYSEHVRNLISQKDLEDFVHLEGYTDNPYRYLNHSDCFVLSSITEGLPNVMLEALYLKIPVVATKCIPFVSETIEEGVTGYCVAVKDFNAMAVAMEKAVLLKPKISNDIKAFNEDLIVSIFQSEI